MSTLPRNRRNIQSEKGSGHFGDTFEAGIKALVGQDCLVSRGRSFDLILNKKRYEIKTGAGELGRVGERACAGVSMIIYCPVFDETKPIEKQEAFVIKRQTFLDLLVDVGLYRTNKATTNKGNNIQAIQTFWNRSKNAPHGKKYYALIDALYDRMEMTLEDFLKEIEVG